MRIHNIVTLLFFLLSLFICFFLLKLNQDLISIDLLFFELEASVGVLILSTFVIGLFVAFLFEILFFLKKKYKSGE
tara:strand:- start:1399 stop:1626 length:228 start_codon:yes stop_codon:yes gene_type:complete